LTGLPYFPCYRIRKVRRKGTEEREDIGRDRTNSERLRREKQRKGNIYK
jgi:hypothetical protein